MGTPSRALVDGAKTFRIGGDEIAINAAIHTLGGFSAHASQSQFIDWIKNFSESRPKLYLMHGEPNAKTALHERLADEGWAAEMPHYGSSISL